MKFLYTSSSLNEGQRSLSVVEIEYVHIIMVRGIFLHMIRSDTIRQHLALAEIDIMSLFTRIFLRLRPSATAWTREKMTMIRSHKIKKKSSRNSPTHESQVFTLKPCAFSIHSVRVLVILAR